LLLRRQGRGTYVAEPEESRILFQFFRLAPDQGAPSFPDSRVLSTGHAKPTKTETEALGLSTGDAGVPYRTHSLPVRPADPHRNHHTARNRFPDFDHLTIIPEQCLQALFRTLGHHHRQRRGTPQGHRRQRPRRRQIGL
jgi:GntR family transcriptional regulator